MITMVADLVLSPTLFEKSRNVTNVLNIYKRRIRHWLWLDNLVIKLYDMVVE